MIKVYGFPRSGNHLLMELIGRNFYPGQDLTSPAGEVGHWSDRAQVGPVEFGKLAGHHGPPSWGYEPGQSVYVYRDGRAVAASLYRSPHFRSKATDGMTFSEWLRAPLDWAWSVGRQCPRMQNVVEHWAEHLRAWERYRNNEVFFIDYETVANCPVLALREIDAAFELEKPDYWTATDKLSGHFPSGGGFSGWNATWSSDDLEWYWQQQDERVIEKLLDTVL